MVTLIITEGGTKQEKIKLELQELDSNLISFRIVPCSKLPPYSICFIYISFDSLFVILFIKILRHSYKKINELYILS